MNDLQGRILYGEAPDPTEEILIGKRVVEGGTVADKIIGKAIVRKLNSNLDKYFSDSSWGYRPGRSPEMTIQHVRKAVRGGAHCVLRTDVKRFFAYVDRDILRKKLAHWVPDNALADFIMAHISPVLLRRGKPTIVERTGLPEGNTITPFLSNVYLDELDQALSGFLYFRYADDILVLGHTRHEVVNAKNTIKQVLRQLGLRLNPEKTFISDLYRQPVVFLGYELRGGRIYPPAKAIRRLEWQLRVRGQGDGRVLMDSFVRRYRIGSVRKLFRRLDRRLGQLYPPGVTLVGLLAVKTKVEGLTKPARHRVGHLGNSLRRRPQS